MIEFDLQLDRREFSLRAAASVTAQATGLFGPSGSGKTTLLHLLAGLLQPDCGRIVVDGRRLIDVAGRLAIPATERRTGLVFQDLRLFPHCSVRANLLYGRPRGRHRSRRTLATLESIVELLRLGPHMSKRVGVLSGGERQRVAIGRAILSSPALLLLDEPLSSLDRPMRREIIQYLRELRRVESLPMIIVSHELGDLLQLAESLLVMRNGTIVGHGAYDDLLHDEKLDARAAVRDARPINVLEVSVGETDRDAGLTRLTIESRSAGQGGGSVQLFAPPSRESLGAVVAVRLRSQDIALSRSAIGGISIQNQLQATVSRVSQHASKSLVQLRLADGTPLHVEVSPKTVRELELEPGRGTWCLIKSSAVEYL
jgi:molybdate transport system ATP-binding protein